MNKIIGFLLIFIFLVLQIALLPHFSVFGVQANILLAAVIVCALVRGGRWSFIFAFFSGAALDIFSSQAFGIFIFNFIFLAWLIEFVGKNFFRSKDFSGQITLAALSCSVFSILNFFLIKLFYWLGIGQDIPFWKNLLQVGLLEILLNFVLTLLGLIIFKKIDGLFARI